MKLIINNREYYLREIPHPRFRVIGDISLPDFKSVPYPAGIKVPGHEFQAIRIDGKFYAPELLVDSTPEARIKRQERIDKLLKLIDEF